MWSRNLGHMFVSPLRPSELMVALFTASFCRTVIGAIPATFLAIAFFGFSVYSLGFALVGFFLNLIVMGWAFGLAVSGIVLRFGMGAESLAWALIFAVAPVCAVYYPVAVLPEWLQIVSALLPASHVFEGMRAILVESRFQPELMLKAIGLNVIYLGLGVSIFLSFFRSARKHGLLHQIGE
jgi:ABC-2 type transport system permease protein